MGYLSIGDAALINFNDVFFSTAGFSYQMTPNTSLSLAYEYQQASLDHLEDGRIASLYLNRQFSNKWLANFYALKGLSNSVADSGTGFTLIRSF